MNAPPPRVSIVLPTHDGARFLERAIGAVLGQTYRDLELVIVDDGSRDRTPEILRSTAAADGRVTVLTNAANRGLPASLNRGFAAARGTYLTWTSDDNEYRAAALERMVGFLDAHPDVDLVYTDFTVIRDGEVGSDEAKVCEDPANLAQVNVVQACFLFRRCLLEAVGPYDESLPCAEDFDYWLRARAAGLRFAPLHEDLYVYRLHGGSLSSRRAEETLHNTVRTLARHVPRLPGLSRGQRARGYQHLSELARRMGDLAGFRRYYARAFLQAPWVVVRRGRSRRSPLLYLTAFLLGFRAAEAFRRTRPGPARR